MKRTLFLAALLVLAACDDKPKDTGTAASASASATPPPTASTAAPTASATASAAPSASASAAAGNGDNAPASKDAQVTVRDPVAQTSATANVIADGAVTLYLPETPGSSWSVPTPDKNLGKAKEQTIPGFVGTTPAHQFVWQIKAPLKAGSSTKVQLVNKKKKPDPGDKDQTFTLTINVK